MTEAVPGLFKITPQRMNAMIGRQHVPTHAPSKSGIISWRHHLTIEKVTMKARRAAPYTAHCIPVIFALRVTSAASTSSYVFRQLSLFSKKPLVHMLLTAGTFFSQPFHSFMPSVYTAKRGPTAIDRAIVKLMIFLPKKTWERPYRITRNPNTDYRALTASTAFDAADN